MGKRIAYTARVSALVVCASGLLSVPAFAATLRVSSTEDAGTGSLRQAIADAAPGDTILIDAAGTITLGGTPLVVTKDLTIVGPGAGALSIDAARASRAFEVGSSATVTISGMTLANGVATSGGGVLNDGFLTLRDTTLTGHSASNEGGGIFNRGTLYLTEVRVTENSAMVGGGVNNRGVVFVLRSTISSNSADGAFGGIGGGIASQAGGFLGGAAAETLTIRDSVISNNTASLRGGGIYNANGLLTIVNSTVAGNACTYMGPTGPCLCPGGAGVYNAFGTARITSSTLAGNSAATAGGALTSLGGLTTLKTTLLAKGISGPNCYVGPSGSIRSDGYNLSDDESCAGALIAPGDRNGVPTGLSPMGLEANGGVTATIQLLPSSVALDAVPVAQCEGHDQRGTLRADANACDIGAYERTESRYAADIQMPVKADGTTVFTASRGVVPLKFVLRVDGAPTCELPAARISVARLAGESIGPISDATYELPADEGQQFRADMVSCQYVYNLGIAALAPGTYWASIAIDGVVVGTATFGIR